MLSSGGRILLEQLEGKRSKMYLDGGGVPTIGIGHVIRPFEQWMNTATLTDSQIYALLDADLATFQNAVSAAIKVPLNQSQFDALTILAFNIGAGAFASSTLVKVINAKETPEKITDAWDNWVKDNGQIIPGLVNRRATEIALYFTGEEKKNLDKSSSIQSLA